MKKNRDIFFLCLSFLFLLILPGCLIDRLIDLKTQLCCFDENYKIINYPSGEMACIARHPVLYDSDIIMLMGAPPSVIKNDSQGRKVFEYSVFKEDNLNEKTYILASAFKFVKLDGQYKLQEVSLGKNITDVFSRKLISDVLKSLCGSGKNIMARRVMVGLNEIDISLLPDPALLNTILGTPDVTTPIGKTRERYVYFFRLKSDASCTGDPVKNAMVEIFYNKEKRIIYRARTHYLRYIVDAMFEKKRVDIKVLMSPMEIEYLKDAEKYIRIVDTIS